jgi:cytochrome c
MDNRQNIMAMMGLGAAIVALGATLVSSEFFMNERPEKMGYVVEGVEAGAESGPTAAPVAIATLLPTADAAKGAEVFKKCASCHTVTQGGAAGVGPNLYGVVGGKHGNQAGFAYSDALIGKAGPWTFEALNEWLTSPKAYAPGTKMSFAGLSKPEDRANLLVYLNAQGSNLPLPAAPAADAAPADAAVGNATEAVANATAPAASATQAAKK